MNDCLWTLPLGIGDAFEDGVVVLCNPGFIGILEGEGTDHSSSRTNQFGNSSSSSATRLVHVHEDDDSLEAKDPTELIGAGFLG